MIKLTNECRYYILYCSQTQNGKIKVHRQFGYKFLNTKNDGGEKKYKEAQPKVWSALKNGY